MMKAAAAAAEKRTMTVMNFANGYQAVESDRCRQFSLYSPSISKEQHTLYSFGATITSCGDVAKELFRKEYRWSRAMKEGLPSTVHRK